MCALVCVCVCLNRVEVYGYRLRNGKRRHIALGDCGCGRTVQERRRTRVLRACCNRMNYLLSEMRPGSSWNYSQLAAGRGVLGCGVTDIHLLLKIPSNCRCQAFMFYSSERELRISAAQQHIYVVFATNCHCVCV